MPQSLFREYSQELAKKILEKISKSNVKEIKGEGNFEVVATTETLDRYDEVILTSAWSFENFLKNPVVLLSHDYHQLPIGAVTDVVADEESKRVVVKGVFANTEEGQTARRLYEDGMLTTMSVGYIAHERNGNIITKAELLEVSFVSVPANPDAIALRRVVDFATKLLLPQEDQGQKNNEKQKTVMEKFENLVDDLNAIRLHYALPAESIEVKSGKVISAKNRLLIQNAIDALQAVLNASEPDTEDAGKMLKELLGDAQSMQKVLENVIKKAKTAKNNL